mmetsp:Transcript_41894/g.103166  ORF Transcript_41894/g.103166 Transcript_41894/m.103166 type:complete len:288 (-) Transcript_41894:30-893(-)
MNWRPRSSSQSCFNVPSHLLQRDVQATLQVRRSEQCLFLHLCLDCHLHQRILTQPASCFFCFCRCRVENETERCGVSLPCGSGYLIPVNIDSLLALPSRRSGGVNLEPHQRRAPQLVFCRRHKLVCLHHPPGSHADKLEVLHVEQHGSLRHAPQHIPQLRDVQVAPFVQRGETEQHLSVRHALREAVRYGPPRRGHGHHQGVRVVFGGGGVAEGVGVVPDGVLWRELHGVSSILRSIRISIPRARSEVRRRPQHQRVHPEPRRQPRHLQHLRSREPLAHGHRHYARA